MLKVRLQDRLFDRTSLLLVFSLILFPAPAALSLERGQVNYSGQSTEEIAQNNSVAEAERLFNEATQLYQQRTPESLRVALTKYEKALSIYQALNNTQKIAETLTSTSDVYDDLGETEKAVNYYKKALPLLQEIKIAKGKNVRAELSYVPGKSFREARVNTTIHLKIFRNEQLLLERQLPTDSQARIYSRIWHENGELKEEAEPLAVRDLDGDPEPEVIIDIYSGEHMHCCSYSLIFHFEPKQNRYTYIDHSWKNIQYTLKDLDGDGIPEFKTGDDRFSYQFASFAGSFFPLQIWQYRQGKMLDATRQYPEEIEINSKGLWQNYLKRRDEGQEVKGVLAAYLASQYLLGKEQEGWEQLEQVYKNSDAPEYFNQLRSFLQANGYTGNALLQEPEIIGSPVRRIQQAEYWLEIILMAASISEESELPKYLNQLGKAYLEVGSAYLEVGEYQKAIDSFNQALLLMRELKNKDGEAFTLTRFGNIYSELGEKQKALEFYNQALQLFYTSGNSSGQALMHNNIGNVHINLGKYQEAIKFFNKAFSQIQVMNEHDVKDFKIILLNNIGGAYLELGNYNKANEYFVQTLSLAQESIDTSMEAQALHNLGDTFYRLGEYEKALDYLKQSLPLRQAAGERSLIPSTLNFIASVERARGNFNEALTRIEAALKIIESLRVNVVSPELRQTYFSTVQSDYQLYISLLMELHQQNPSQGYDKKAFHISERSRARTLLELLTEANANIKEGVDSQLLAKEKSLQGQLDAIETQRLEIYNNSNSTSEQKTAIDQQHQTLLKDYEELQTDIRKKSPKYADLKYPQPLTLEQVQQQILDRDTVLLQYSLGKEQSYVWVVTKEEMTSYPLPAQKEIEKRAKNLLKFTTQGNPKAFTQAVTPLSQAILAPVKDKLTKKRIVVVADGVLQYIPFAALSLSENQQPLITNYEVINLPSSSSLATIRYETQARKPAPKVLAVLADPVFSINDKRINNTQDKMPGIISLIAQRLKLFLGRLFGLKLVATNEDKTTDSQPKTSDLESLALKRSVRSLRDGQFGSLLGTRQEAEAILKLIRNKTKKTSAFDFDANLTTATNPELSQYRIVHFATHGILNPESPELSGIVLSLVDETGNTINGFLRLHEIFNLNLPAEIVVLSACETGVAKDIKGEGLVGLTRGFMYAGSPRVLVSLWKVDDEATAEIMTRFYRLMLKKKLSPAEALRKAQLEMQQETEWTSPYYWSAFVLQGEWR